MKRQRRRPCMSLREKQANEKGQTTLGHQKRSIHLKYESNLFTDVPPSVYLIYSLVGSWEETRQET